MEAYQAGNELFVDEDYQGALEKYDEAIKSDDSQASFFDKRSAVHAKLGNIESSFNDASAAVKLNDKMYSAYVKQGTAAFQLERYKESQVAFTQAKKLASNDSQKSKMDTWLRKCEAEVGEELVLEEEPVVEETPVEPPVPARLPFRYKYEWYQTLDTVTVTVMAKKVPQDMFEYEVDGKSLVVRVGEEGSDMNDLPEDRVLELEFFGTVSPAKEDIRMSHSQYKIEIKFKKNPVVQWPTLTKDGAASASPGFVIGTPAPLAPGAGADALPTPYATKKKDWNKIEAEIVKETTPTGEEQALEDLFRNIYKDSSDETRRAMIKSFQTSGGTVLSTNWDEVGKTDYEKKRTAPDGVEWRSWEGDKIKGEDTDSK